MCMTCGCGDPHEDHGNPDNITHADLEKAAKAADIKPQEALESMRSTMRNA